MLYLAGYAVFRFLVEFVRGNEVAWPASPGRSCSSLVTIPLLALRIVAAHGGRLRGRSVGALGDRYGRGVEQEVSRMSGDRARPGMPLRGLAGPPLRQRVLPALPRGASATGRWPRSAGCRAGWRCATAGSGSSAAAPTTAWSARCTTSRRDPALPRAVDRADQGARARPRRQLQAGAGGLRGRPAGDADPAHLHPAGGHHRPLQPALPDLLRRLVAGARRRSRRSSEVLASIDARLARENGRLDVLMLSGGEPTLYPWLAELLDAVAARPVVRILVNTNGLRIAQDDALLDLLARHRERVEVYLQYDGESADGVGAPPRRRHPPVQGARDRAGSRSAGVFTTLTMTAALGVNDDEIGAVLKRALDTPYVGGVTIQPVFGSGRGSGHRPDATG